MGKTKVIHTPDVERDARGRILPGHTANPNGRPKREVERAALASIVTTATPDAIAEITSALIKAAKGGDVSAARLLFDYVAGKPAEQVNLTNEAVEEITLAMPAFAPLPDGATDEQRDFARQRAIDAALIESVSPDED